MDGDTQANAGPSRVEEVFLDLLDRTLADRTERLQRLRSEDPALAAEVESLLASSETGGLMPELSEERPFEGRFPDRIGQYRIVRPLGEGGMGVVLLAIREGEGFEQTVALKLLRGRWVDPLLTRRLEEERRLLARLEHPGIARLVDGGITEDGQPFYAMEYVAGEDLHTWCDTRNLDVEGRLRLFIEICEAVHYAHQALVVHRDLKPSNILIAAGGIPKLLDFGIAKSMEGVDPEEPTTAWVTPAYASPEQVLGQPVSTRSDVYSLGVLLCELIAGGRPYDTSGKTPAQLGRVIEESRPARPSDVAQEGLNGAESAEAVALRRHSTPRQLSRRLRGDLDLIVLKALARDPNRRYSSAAALADDLRRHLENRPIEARPDGIGYVVGKFVRRHRALTAAAAALAITIIGGTAAVLNQSRIAVAERDRAEEEADRARLVTTIMTDLFRLGDPTVASGDTIGVRQVLDEGFRRVDETLTDDPVLQASLFLELGRVYHNLGLLAEAARAGDRARLLRSEQARESLDYADVLGFMGRVRRDQGEGEQAVAHYTQAIDLRNRILGAPDTVTAVMMSDLGWQIRDLGEHQRANMLLDSALTIQRQLMGDEHPEVAATLLGLAATLHEEGRFDEAESLLLEALDRSDPENPDPASISLLINAGMVHRLRENYVEAEVFLTRAAAAASAVFGPDHPESLAAGEQLVANLSALGRYAEAEALVRPNLEVAIRTLGEGHSRTRGAREALAQLELERGDFEIAAARIDSVIGQKIAANQGDHPGVVYSLIVKAEAEMGMGRIDEAQRDLEQALEMGLRLGEGNGVYSAWAHQSLAEIALDRGGIARADSLLSITEEIHGQALRPGHRYVLDAGRLRARIELAQGDPGAALERLTAVLALEADARPLPHPRRGMALRLIGDAQWDLGRVSEARSAWEEALAQMGQLRPHHPEVVRIRNRLNGA